MSLKALLMFLAASYRIARCLYGRNVTAKAKFTSLFFCFLLFLFYAPRQPWCLLCLVSFQPSSTLPYLLTWASTLVSDRLAGQLWRVITWAIGVLSEEQFYNHTSEFCLTEIPNAQWGLKTKRCGHVLIRLSALLLERLINIMSSNPCKFVEILLCVWHWFRLQKPKGK